MARATKAVTATKAVKTAAPLKEKVKTRALAVKPIVGELVDDLPASWKGFGDVKLPEKWDPHKYQKKAVKFLLEHACAGLFLDPGLGKTSITLAAIVFLKKRNLIGKVLLIAPLRVIHSTWPREIQKWLDFQGLTLEVLHGPKKDAALAREADIYVINPEGLEWLTQVEKIKTPKGKIKVSINMRRWKSLGFDTLVVDELSKFKNTATTRFKMLRLIIGSFSRRWGLTGSPSAGGLEDLFGQCYVLDEGRSLGQFITHYRREYFDVDHTGYNYTVRKGAEKEIYKRIAPLVLQMSASDYLELPTMIENNIMIQLPDDVMEFYNSLESDLIAKINDKKVTAANAAVASGKCRQVVNGGIYLTPDLDITGFKLGKTKREWLDLHTEKVDALADLIDELQGSPLLVAYDFEHDLSRLQAKFGKDMPYIGKGVSVKRGKELEKLWNAGKLPYLFGHPQSIAHGLNLQEIGNHVCWHSMTWSFELYDQFIKRVLRQGNKNKHVFVHHLLAENTIDMLMLDVLKGRNHTQQALFSGLKELAKKRIRR